MQEDWRPVVGHEQLYEVSASGQVRNIRGKLLKHHVSSDRYHEVSLSKDKKSNVLKVHRLVVAAFLPDQWNEELEVNHKDGNKNNNHFSNLEMVTHAQNMDHYWRSEVFQEHQKAYLEYAKETMTARWKNPEFRSKVQAVFDSPEYKKAHKAAGKKVYDDPTQRKKASERSRRMWSAEGFHDKQVDAIKQGWSDPSKREEASNRVRGLVWMSSSEGVSIRVPSSEVDDMLSKGYKVGRTSLVSKNTQVYCAMNGKIYPSMSACDVDLGLKSGDTYAMLKGKFMPKRLISVQQQLQLSIVE